MKKRRWHRLKKQWRLEQFLWIRGTRFALLTESVPLHLWSIGCPCGNPDHDINFDFHLN